MYELLDIFLQRRRLFIDSFFIIIALLLIFLLAPPAKSKLAGIIAYNHAAYTSRAPHGAYDSPDVVTNTLSQIANETSLVTNAIEAKMLSGTMSVATVVTSFDQGVGSGAQAVINLPAHSNSGIAFLAHAISGGVASTMHVTAEGMGFLSGITNISSFIRPTDHTPIPTITQLRAQQATLIQSGTRDVVVTAVPSGVGGACDNGDGNGGYPQSWCNAPVDSVMTILNSGGLINRECTSYAYWYFTSVEGHTDFRVRGNAKYWASTSNYQTHVTPAVGSIAVETAGAYGHVAIVQALPGQEYNDQVVPLGYVLVSEMNYDWRGHFRYSYSPLNKFTAYIYP